MSETARKTVHLAMGGLAFLLKYLTPAQAACAAAAAIAFNRFVLPLAGGRALFRQDEVGRALSSGIVTYPVAVLLLILLFHDRLEVAAAAWVIMAAGDAAAGLVGRRFGRRRLPWNKAKTLEGSAAFAAAAGCGAWAVLVWMGRPPLEALLLAAPTAVFGALVESLPWGLDDNLTVPLLSALFLAGLLLVDGGRLEAALPALGRGLLVGGLVNASLALLFRRAGVVDPSGAIAGWGIGTLTWAFAGGRGFAVLLSFFILGSAATRLGRRRKEAAGTAQTGHGARSARHALANCGVAVCLAFLAAAAPSPEWLPLAFVCAYATAAFDTVSGEIGRAYGGRPRLITTLRAVPAGTNGAVSLLGTAAGVAAAAAIGAVAWGGGLIPPERLPVVVAAAFAGSTVDSLLGATLEARGLIDNEGVNVLNTLAGALSGGILAALI